MTPRHDESRTDRWFGRRLWMLILALMVIGVVLAFARGVWLASRHALPQEVLLVGQNKLSPGRSATYRVKVQDGRVGKPVAYAFVTGVLTNPDGREIWRGETQSDDAGIALLKPKLDLTANDGRYGLRVDVNSRAGDSVVWDTIEVKRTPRLILTADKPVYQPGQTMHIRLEARTSSDLQPIAKAKVDLEISNIYFGKVYERQLLTSIFGIATTDFIIADRGKPGPYTIRAKVGDITSEFRVLVDTCLVDLKTEKSSYHPGEIVRGSVAARDAFGNPARRVDLSLHAIDFLPKYHFYRLAGRTDDFGRFEFEVPLNKNFSDLANRGGEAKLVLTADLEGFNGHAANSLPLPVTENSLRIELIPEAGELVSGVENVVYVVTSYPDGRPARATVATADAREQIVTSEAGIGELRLTPTTDKVNLTLTATSLQGEKLRSPR